MTRPTSRQANLEDIVGELTHCDQRLVTMRREQTASDDADAHASDPASRHAIRRFSEEHAAFLSASSSLGDYLKRAAIRQFAKAEIEPYLETPLAVFHRELRNSLAHRHRLQYGRSKNVEWHATIAPSRTFPIPLLALAASRGALVYEQTPVKVGPGVFCYQGQHLEPHIARLLEAVKASGKIYDSGSVIFFAERYLDGLRMLVVNAERRLRQTP